MTTTKEIASPAKYKGKECDLEPEEREDDCTTDCCTGNLVNTSPNTDTVFLVECEEDQTRTNSSCSATCGTGAMTVTTVKRTRKRDSKDCDICSDPEATPEVVDCTRQDCPPGKGSLRPKNTT